MIVEHTLTWCGIRPASWRSLSVHPASGHFEFLENGLARVGSRGVLRGGPSLQNLSLKNNGRQPATDTLLARLTFGSSQLCPKLATMTFDSSSFSSDPLADMIESRWKNPSVDLISSEPSHPVEVRGCVNPAPKRQLMEDMKRLRRLAAKGLKVVIS